MLSHHKIFWWKENKKQGIPAAKISFHYQEQNIVSVKPGSSHLTQKVDQQDA